MQDKLDWGHLQSFAAVATHGSLSAAAREVGASQPTLGRHIRILEANLGVRLFERRTGGLELTPNGTELLEQARDMEAAANRLALAAAGRSQAVRGTVRITASEIVAAYILPEMLAALHTTEPEIDIELVAADRVENLLKREADIAVRMFRPTQMDVITRKVGDLQTGIYAAHQYLDRRGEPASISEIFDHDVVGYDRNDLILQGFRAAGYTVDRDFFKFRCDNQIVAWRMVVAGFGLGFNQTQIGDRDGRVKRLLSDAMLPVLPIWLTAHAELKTSRRVRKVYDFLSEQLAKYAKADTG